MLPGGIADKQGNRYESKWLVRKLLDVLRGDASSILYEVQVTVLRVLNFSLFLAANHSGIK